MKTVASMLSSLSLGLLLLACGSDDASAPAQAGASSQNVAAAECASVCEKLQVDGCSVSKDRCVQDECRFATACPARAAFLQCHQGKPFVCGEFGPTPSACSTELQGMIDSRCVQGLYMQPDGVDPNAPGSVGGTKRPAGTK